MLICDWIVLGDVGTLGYGHGSLPSMWREKLRKLLLERVGSGLDEKAAEIVVVKLFERPLAMERGEVAGLVGAVWHKLLLRVLLPVEGSVEEPLVLELIFRSLLKAEMLLTGGLEGTTIGAFDTCDSGAA
ncbi:hypothetical protein KC335_g14416 [Hortaea werneckii]|nr:hypothetical protein KC335_g14416 [Hortaea werneckii]